MRTKESKLSKLLVVLAVMVLSFVCGFPAHAASVTYFIQADQTTPLGADGTANLPPGNTNNGTYRTTFTTSAPSGFDTQIRNSIGGTSYAHLANVYLDADYGGNVQISGTSSGTIYVRTDSDSDRLKLVLIDYDPVTGTIKTLATSTEINGYYNASKKPIARTFTIPAPTDTIPVDHRLMMEILFKPNSWGNVGRVYCNSSSYTSFITLTETITGVTHTITASSGGNGTISPSGATTVNHKSSQSFTMVPDTGFGLSDVVVDSVNHMGPVNPYTFINVTADHTINAVFLPTYTITTSPGANGTITPAGPYEIVQGASQTFAITANSGYAIQQVYVDGNPQGPMDSYTFSNVAENHTISATFVPLHTITATADSNGSITPGTVTVVDGDSQLFVFSPNSGYTVDDVKVDGVSMGTLSSYKFTNITSNHTIQVTFTLGPTMNSYCIKPPFLATTIPPNVMIMLSVETPMQGAAHPDLTCEGTPTTTYKCKSNATDVGGRNVVNNYNNSTDYYGYFDTAKCYDYQGGVFKYHKAATNHQCGGDSWSGNFLNFATMTAVDAFRKAFSGGNRDTDAVGNTILLGANQTRSPGDSWYPIRKIDNADLYMPSADGGGATRYIVRHANGFSVCSSAACTVKQSGSGENNFPTKTGASADVVSVYNFRVKVCDPSLGGLEVNCNAETNKPEGVIQKYADKMRFGLMSYTNINDFDRDGGVLRTKMKWIIPKIPFGMNYHDVHGALVTCASSNGCSNPEAELNASGTFLPNPDNASGGNSSGVINYINKFGYASGYKSHDPVSELYYEIIRYFKNLTPSTNKYCDDIGNSNDGFMAHCSSSKPTNVKASEPYWRDPFVYPCQQSFVVAVNDANPWLDKRVPGTAFTENYATTPAYTDYGVPSNEDTSINSLKWTNKVGDVEGLTPGDLPVGCVYDGSTTCDDFTTSNKYVKELGRAVGTYPSGSKENSYYIAGLSYYAHVNDLRSDIEGKQTITTYMIDTQEPQKDGMLVGNKNMLFLAAKFGGFREIDGTLDSEGFAKPYKDATCGTGSSSNAKCEEWDENGDGMPDTYFFASDPTKIEEGLNNAFSDILRRMASGTAASILNNSEGSGASLIQAIFYPEREFDTGSKVQWSGELHSLWYYLDPYLSNSTIREDSDSNFYLDLNQDKITQFYFNGNETLVARYNDTNSDGAADGAAVDTDIMPDAIHSLWRAGFSLFSRDLSSNPRVMKTTLDGATLIDFSDTNKSNTTLQTYLRATGATVTDLENDTAKIINYIKGTDQTGYRSRTVKSGATTREWRLGDIISSTPKLQSTIRLNSYNLTAPYGYGDTSYGLFVKSTEYGKRGLAYVGANDGMLHAFKLGILDVSGQTKTRKAHLINEGSGSLGDEMWTFIPKGVLPYLKYYSEPKYDHLYYVDNTVSIVDASINYTSSDPGYFPDCSSSKYWNCEKRTQYVASSTSIDTTNTSWRTILIGGMGLGGASRFWGDTCSTATDCVKSPLATVGISSYFALDVTDQTSPTLKWEFSDPDLGYTTTGPAIVRVGAKGKNGRWFAVFGSGPTGPIDTVNHQFLGASDKTLKLYILDLNASPPFIKGTAPNTPSNANYWVIDTGIANAFAGSLANAVIDTDRGDTSSTGHYSDDAVYVGYVKKANTTWTSGGVGRIFTKESTDPAEWAWNVLIDDVGPVTTSVTKSQDRKNKKLWIYFGTGRYFFRNSGSADDPDSQRSLFGIMEPCYYTATYPKNDLEGSCTASVSLSNLNNQTTDVDKTLSTGDKGWVINLDTSALKDGFMSERVITDPIASSSGAVFFTTFRPTFDVCSYGGNTYIWSVRYDTGAEPPTAALKGKALMQVSTGSFAELTLSSAFGSKNNRRTTTPIKGVPPKSQGLSLLAPPRPTKKVLQIQEK
jgi:Tfp pilus tip-associated adhesin PilY1